MTAPVLDPETIARMAIGHFIGDAGASVEARELANQHDRIEAAVDAALAECHLETGLMLVQVWAEPRESAPFLDPSGNIERQAQAARALKDWEEGRGAQDVYARLIFGTREGDAELSVDSVPGPELELTALRLISTTARAVGQQLMEGPNPQQG